MNVARSAAEVLDEHSTLELECIDRMYLNVYVPVLQTGAGASYFFRRIRGNPMPSSALMAPMTRRFVADLEGFAKREGVDLIRFERGERKDERTKEYVPKCIGDGRHDPVTGAPYPWLADSTAMVNHYYVYLVDEDFGPLFVKFCSTPIGPTRSSLIRGSSRSLQRLLASASCSLFHISLNLNGFLTRCRGCR